LKTPRFFLNVSPSFHSISIKSVALVRDFTGFYHESFVRVVIHLVYCICWTTGCIRPGVVFVVFTRQLRQAGRAIFFGAMAAAASTGGWWSGLVSGAKQGDVDGQSVEGGAWLGLGGAAGTY
jgi:hypothetical protein